MYNQTHLLTMVKKLFKDRKFKIGDNVRTSKYKNIFAKDYVTNWFKEVFIIQIFRNTMPWRSIFSNLNGEEIVGTFDKKEL